MASPALIGFEMGQQRKQALQDQQRQAQLSELDQTGGLTEEQRAQALRDLYAKNPSAFRQHVSNLVGRLAGRAPKPIVPSNQPQQDFNSILAKGTTPEQQATALEERKNKAAMALQELKNAGIAQRGSTSRPVPYYAGAVNKKNAMAMQDAGKVYFDAEGNPIDVSTIPEGMFMLPVFAGNGKEYWEVGTDKQRYETAGNQRLAEPAVGGPNPEAPSLGPVRVPTETTRTATSPGGAQVVTGTSTVVPQNSTIPATVPTGPAPRRAGPTLKTRPQSGAPTPKAGGETGSILPNIQSMTPQNAAAARKTIPAATALLGLYGDPQNPSAPSMVEYSKLANDPHAQKVLGEAFKLLDQQMGEISDPGVLQTLMTGAGWANFRAQAEAGAQQAAGTQMTPAERAYFDAAIASMADIIGSRAATGQSAARFSVRSIQNELPLIGLSGTPDATSYLNKMLTIGRQLRVGLTAMPDNKRALAWLNKREGDIAKDVVKRAQAQQPIVQRSKRTGQYRYSTDGGATWQPGQPPRNNPPAQ